MCSIQNTLLRSYINNSCFVFYQRFPKQLETINALHTAYGVVLSSVSRCLEPLMKYLHSLLNTLHTILKPKFSRPTKFLLSSCERTPKNFSLDKFSDRRCPSILKTGHFEYSSSPPHVTSSREKNVFFFKQFQHFKHKQEALWLYRWAFSTTGNPV